MPYPETCPECGGAFRNTGTHYTARRNEVGRHVLLELGCQNTSRRYWWDFTSGTAAEDGTSPGRRASNDTEAINASLHHESNGRSGLATIDPPATPPPNGHNMEDEAIPPSEIDLVSSLTSSLATEAEPQTETAATHRHPQVLEPSATPPSAPPSLKEAFVRQLQLDRLTLRQMRSWLMADEARRAIEVAAGATEATYERLALILFGVDLPQLLGKQPAPAPGPGMSAEERLELQREKARIRARLRRAAAKAARQ
jgi:hypothetical protein